MPFIIPCLNPDHEEFANVELTPDLRWDKPGHLCGQGIVDGASRWLNCESGCMWQTPPAVEKTLGSVGDPTAALPDQRLRSSGVLDFENNKYTIKHKAKEKNMPKAETPRKRERLPKKPIAERTFGAGIKAVTYLKGATPENLLAQTDEDNKALRDWLKSVRGEP